MPNVFNGIEKMDKENVSYQLASLQQITMVNVTSEMYQKGKKSCVKVFNGIKRLFKGSESELPQVVSLDDRIKNQLRINNTKSLEELQNTIRQVLIEKSKSVGTLKTDSPSDDELSVAVINAACKCFKEKMPDDISPARKADLIRSRYNERMVLQLAKQMKNNTYEQEKNTEKAIQDKLDNMSEEKKQELKKALKINELTGETISKLLKTTAGTTAVMIALDASGFGAYMALTTIMHAIFTTTLQITLPFAAYTGATSVLAFITGPFGWLTLGGVQIYMLTRSKNKLIYELLAQIVWASVEAYGGRFTPKDEELPSWLPDSERDAQQKNSKILMEMIKENDALKQLVKRMEYNLDRTNKETIKNQEQIKELTSRIHEEERRYNNAMKEKSSLSAKVAKAEALYEEQVAKLSELEKRASENDTYLEELNNAKHEKQRLYSEYSAIQRRLAEKDKDIEESLRIAEDADNKIKECDMQIVNLKKEKEKNEEQIKELTTKLESSNNKVNDKLDKTVQDVSERWGKAFKKFEFATGVVRYVCKNYEYNEFGNIECALIELHGAKDPMAIANNRGKMSNGDAHMGFSTPSGFPSRIMYRMIKNAPGGKTVRITQIVKHNDPRYGK